MTALQTHASNGHANGFDQLHNGEEHRVENDVEAVRELEAHARQAHLRQLTGLTAASSSLRHPLEPIRRAAALLEYAHADRSLLARLQHIIESQLAYLSSIIDAEQGGADANSGEECNQRGTVDLTDLLGLAITWSRSTLSARRQVLIRQAPRGAPRVRGDAVRLRQAFSRVLEHASAHSPRGDDITLSTQEHGESVTVTVADKEFELQSQTACNNHDAQPPETCAMSHDNHGPSVELAELSALLRAYGGSIAVSGAGKGRCGAYIITLPKA